MNELPERDHVLVAVAPDGGDGAGALVQRLKAIAADCGHSISSSLELGQHAAEVFFSSPDDDALAGLRTSAGRDLAAHADWCLIPATDRRKKLLVSDMDSTIIGQECIDELADYAGIKAEISAITERAMRGELDFEEALKTRVGLLKGLDLNVIEQCYNERIRLNPGAAELVATMSTYGARCLLVSGGFTAFTRRVAHEAGFHSDSANQLLDDGKTLNGKVREPILGRAAKRETLLQECARMGIEASESLALGDGANDLDMIRASGLGVAYRAKPIVAGEADAAINLTGLTTALYFQGYSADQIVSEPTPRLRVI